MQIALQGAPGAGKGTQALMLAEHFEVPLLSVMEMVRDASQGGSPYGLQARSLKEAGLPIADEVVIGVISERLKEPDTRNGFILDGFPRTLQQAKALDIVLQQAGRPLQLMLVLEGDLDDLMQRLLGRRTCLSCGQTFNNYTAPSRLESQCDVCGGNLNRRGDDNEETFGNRLRFYETQTLPMVEYYREREIVDVVSCEGSVRMIFSQLKKYAEAAKDRVVTVSADAITEAVSAKIADDNNGVVHGGTPFVTVSGLI